MREKWFVLAAVALVAILAMWWRQQNVGRYQLHPAGPAILDTMTGRYTLANDGLSWYPTKGEKKPEPQRP